MIISRTPFRLSFFGGGTDYPVWYDTEPGAVLVTTINKYAYISCRYLPPFFDHKTKVVWSKIERVNDLSEIQHPSARATLQFMEIQDGVEIHHDGDLPARSGLGSSSAFTVGLLHALHALKGSRPPQMELARQAIHIEQNVLREHVGSQDQVATAVGGLNRITFGADDAFQVTPVVCPRPRLDALQDHLMLTFTGLSRNASEIAAEQVQSTRANGATLLRIRELVDEALALLCGADDLTTFGRLLDEGWQLKRSLTARISNPEIDAMYAAARQAGAIGGKLLGAGGGGFLLLFVPPPAQPRVREALHRLLHVPFRFESSGTQIIFHDVDGGGVQ